jgi:hypothetical protein
MRTKQYLLLGDVKMASAPREDYDASVPDHCTRSIHVRAERVIDHGNGIFTLEIPVHCLSEVESRSIERLFPHTMEKIDEALGTEALLASQLSWLDYEAASKSGSTEVYPTTTGKKK